LFIAISTPQICITPRIVATAIESSPTEEETSPTNATTQINQPSIPRGRSTEVLRHDDAEFLRFFASDCKPVSVEKSDRLAVEKSDRLAVEKSDRLAVEKSDRLALDLNCISASEREM